MEHKTRYTSIERLEENEYYLVVDLPVSWYIAGLSGSKFPNKISNLVIIRTGAGLDKQSISADYHRLPHGKGATLSTGIRFGDVGSGTTRRF